MSVAPDYTAARHKAASSEQIERIRQLSTVALGSPGAAFTKYGYPSTRGRASDIIRELDQSRGWGREDHEHKDLEEEETPTMDMTNERETKTCRRCGTEKTLDEFTRGQSRCKTCINEVQRDRYAETKRGRSRAQKTTTEATTSPPPAVAINRDPAPVNGDWKTTWADPTLSQLEELRHLLGAPTLDEAAGLVRLITS